LFSFLDVAIDRKLKVQRLLGTLNSLFFAASSSPPALAFILRLFF